MQDVLRLDRVLPLIALLVAPACGDDVAPADDTGTTGEETGGSPTTNPSTSSSASTTATTTDVDTSSGSEESSTTDPPTTGDTEGTTTTGDTEGTTTTGDTEGTTTDDLCGNDVVDAGEDCDNDDLDGETCDSLGRGDGELACADDCTFDVSGCNVAEVCGNGAVEGAEACDDNNVVDGDGCSSQCELDGGDTCEAPNYVYEIPYTFSGDTADFGNEYDYVAGACETIANLPANGGANDVVFSFTPEATGLYTLDFEFAGDGILWIVTDCADKDNTCVQAADAIVDGGETMYANLTAGETYYIIMGHWATEGVTAAEGAFTFSIDTCTPTVCDDMFCGDDGCGGTCGCASGQVCDIEVGMTSGVCIDPPPGDTCGDARLIDPAALPYMDSDNTLLYGNDYGYGSGVCPGEEGGWNAGAEDVVYEFTPDTDATYIVEFGATWDSTVWIVTDCDNIDGTCVAGQDNQFFMDPPEQIITPLSAGTTYFIIGGHWSNTTPGGGGDYTLTVSEPCFPTECDGVTCGDDGCGGTCGCALGEFCIDGTCSPPPPGDTCADPIIVGALPYNNAGDTLFYLDDYGYSAGVCPGEEGGWNGAAEEVVYSFTPAADGNFTFTFTSTWDSTIWIVTDCANIDGTCVGGADAEFTNDSPEVITTDLIGGTTYFIMAGHYDNFTPGFGGPYTLDIVEN